MADYYPLIAKAVAGLQSSTPETRGAIYQRARNALLGQLRRLDPPIPESDVARESASLEDAIARLEAELAPPSEVEWLVETLVESSVETRVEEAIPASPAEIEAPAAPTPTEVEATPEATPESVERQSPPPPEPPPVAQEPSREEPSQEEASQQAPEAAPAPAVGEAPASEASAEEAHAPQASTRPQPAPPPAFFKLRRDKPSLFTPPPRPDGFSARRAPGSAPAFRPPLFPPPPGSAPVADATWSAPPPAPGDFAPRSPDRAVQEPVVEESSPRDLGGQETVPEASGANAAHDFEPATPHNGAPDVVAAEPGADESVASRRISPALAKPRPEAQRPSAPQPRRDAAAPRRLWIVGFIVGLLVFLVAIAAFQLRDRPEDLRQKAATPVIAPEAGANGKIVDRIGVGSDGTQSAPASSSADNAAQGASAAKSAAGADEATSSGGRAALLVEAPDEPSKVRTYLGTVVWKVDNVSNGPGDPLSMAVSAEIDIPEEKLQTAVTLQKNFDGSLPASHTMKIQFTEAPDGPLGAIQQISVPQMRREDTATGDGLSGIPVAITDNSFLVGLTRGAAEANNIDLLTSREWIDVPMLLSNGKIAKLTFEKGPTGVRAITDALAAWKAQ
ncbi:hypothetical protein [Methylocella sp.]|jgi:hypothetical protein|uniref:hypothetical protein n=1 Tax=Methylocella sp. TaxID=1978226 RepID=UPI003C20D165